MTSHRTGTRDEWLAARKELLAREKEHTRRGDELARERRELPWVPVEKEYAFDTEDGVRTLAQLFCGHSQLIVYHFMLGPDDEAGCPSCSSIADGFEGFHVHLAKRADARLVCVSRAPLAQLEAYKRRMGWTFPWVSSSGSDFNYDFGVTLGPDGGEYNFGTERFDSPGEMPGMSSFAIEDGAVFHAYSAYARGLDGLWGAYQWMDRAPLGRNGDEHAWVRRDEYQATSAA